MNFARQNNPAVIGALVIVLVGSLTMVIKQFSKVRDSMATQTGSSAASAAAADTSTPATIHEAADPSQTITRPAIVGDPFQHPPSSTGHRRADTPNTVVDVTLPERATPVPSPPLALPAMAIRPLPAPQVTRPAIAATTHVPGDISSGHAAVIDPTSSWRLSAVIVSPRPTAVIDVAGQTSREGRVGDRIDGYSIVAIHSREIVLSGPRGLRTMPITDETTAPPATPVASDNDTSGNETADTHENGSNPAAIPPEVSSHETQ